MQTSPSERAVDAPASTTVTATSVGPVQLLWTGGWDSTYRLLDLVLRQGREVCPHYIVDPDRPGTLHELQAMRAIRHRVAKAQAGRERLIRPTRTTLLDSIGEDPLLTAKFEGLKRRAYLGTQYDWLARYIKERGIRELELCIHADDRAEGFVREHVEQVPEDGTDGYWRVRAAAMQDDIGLFSGFRFPILHLTKCEMRRRAEAAGFKGIMALTWFCHKPIAGQPCGICNPCRYTIAEGLADRLPGRALLRNRFDSQLKMTRKIGGLFYQAAAKVARPLIRRERLRRGVKVS